MNEKPNSAPPPYPQPPGGYPGGHHSSPLPHNVINIQPGMAPPPPPGAPVQWMAPPPTIPNCPPGLEYLTMVDKLFVNQRISLMEAFTGWEISNKYAILNGAGEQVYFAFEESECCERQCCANARGYTMHIVDNFNREVMKVTRPFKCCTCCWCANSDGCGSETTIEAPPGNVIGVVRQRAGCCSNNFVVKDARDETDLLRIEGPNQCSFTYCCNCCADRVFEISTIKDGAQIGNVTKKFRGCAQEAFTNADLFSVEFPLDLDLHVKAVLVGATFLIDLMEFEMNKSSNNSSSSN